MTPEQMAEQHFADWSFPSIADRQQFALSIAEGGKP